MGLASLLAGSFVLAPLPVSAQTNGSDSNKAKADKKDKNAKKKEEPKAAPTPDAS